MMFSKIEIEHVKLIYSSPDPKGQMRYYHSESVVCSP